MKDGANKKGGHITEIILIAILLSLGLISLLVINSIKDRADTVLVTVDGEYFAEYPLSVDGEYDIGGTNILKIEDGKAFMLHADCPDKLCVKSGKISFVGETVVCLPNRVMLELVYRGAES